MATRYLIGQGVEFITAGYEGDEPIDLTTTALTLTITRPDSTTVEFDTADLTLDETRKVLWVVYVPPLVGTYTWYWVQTGELPAADEGAFIVYAAGDV